LRPQQLVNPPARQRAAYVAIAHRALCAHIDAIQLEKESTVAPADVGQRVILPCRRRSRLPPRRRPSPTLTPRIAAGRLAIPAMRTFISAASPGSPVVPIARTTGRWRFSHRATGQVPSFCRASRRLSSELLKQPLCHPGRGRPGRAPGPRATRMASARNPGSRIFRLPRNSGMTGGNLQNSSSSRPKPATRSVMPLARSACQ
jgi:hypothetical protein